MTIRYPEAKTVNQTDAYHGIVIHDPYRWLEDANADDTKAWVEAENAVTEAYLETIPERDAIRDRLTALWDYEKYGAPVKRGGRYFYSYNSGLQNQSVYYVADSLDAAGRVLLDPNTWSTGGTVALSGLSINREGTLAAYGVAIAGSDWQEWRVRDVVTGEDLSDHLRWIKFSGASWTKDGKGLFYSRYSEPDAGQALQESNFFHKLYYHRLGDEQSSDTLVYERPDKKEWNVSGSVTDDGRYLLIYTHQGTSPNNCIYIKDLGPGGSDLSAPAVPLFDAEDAQYSVIGNDGQRFYVKTDKDAQRGRVIAAEADSAADPQSWRSLVPETANTLQGVSLFGDTLYLQYLKDVCSVIQVYALDGTPGNEIELPGLGSAGGFGGLRDDTETFYVFSSYTTPATVFRYDIATGASTVFRKPDVAFDPSEYVSERVFYASKDGTKIPLFLTYKKGIVLDGSNPTFLYGYGGFRISLTPGFSPAMLVWLEMGGVYAVANLRGGGEYGEEWHQAGMKDNKQNVFDDFIAAGEWLIASGYTSKSKLAIAGGSNGGLLVGACLNQRPDLYAAALPSVGVMDMLRFDKFTIGWAWKSDFGAPDDPEMFRTLLAYSPLHNIRSETVYPATLVTTSDHDDRVVPAHSYKYAAALQASQAKATAASGKSDAPPTLIRIETSAGHGAGKPTSKIIDEYADRFAFLLKNLGVKLDLR